MDTNYNELGMYVVDLASIDVSIYNFLGYCVIDAFKLVATTLLSLLVKAVQQVGQTRFL